MLSIIIPARNEADSLEDIVNYFEENLLEVDFEVLLINDFSDDETLSKAKKIFQLKFQVHFMNCLSNNYKS